MLLRDRNVLITGGASGLGGAAVDMVAAAGGRAVIVDVNAEAGRAKAAQHGSSARFQPPYKERRSVRNRFSRVKRRSARR